MWDILQTVQAKNIFLCYWFVLSIKYSFYQYNKEKVINLNSSISCTIQIDPDHAVYSVRGLSTTSDYTLKLDYIYIYIYYNGKTQPGLSKFSLSQEDFNSHFWFLLLSPSYGIIQATVPPKVIAPNKGLVYINFMSVSRISGPAVVRKTDMFLKSF